MTCQRDREMIVVARRALARRTFAVGRVALWMVAVNCVWAASVLAQAPASDANAAQPLPTVAAGQPSAPDAFAGGTQLPWVKNESAARPLPPRPAATARELLINVDDSELSHFIDRQPLDTSDEETLVRILHRLPAFPVEDVERLAHQDTPWQQLAEEPDRHRVEIFRLSGQVTSVAREAILPELAVRLEYDHYYRVMFEVKDVPHPVVVCSRKVPAAWRPGQPLKEPAEVYGLFIKVGDTSGPHPQLVFAADRIAWYPDRADPALGIGPAHVLLAKLGFDVGLLDDVRKTNGHRVTGVDRESFYRLLAATGRAAPAQLRDGAQSEFQLVSLLKDPRDHHGQLAMVHGVARRITKVLVNDEDIQARFKINHYYQIDLFIPLGNQLIRLGSPKELDEDRPVYRDGFPVTVCTLRLPDGLTEGDVRESVRMPAFFFKLWAYRSEYVSSFNKDRSQISPLFMALEPEVVPPAPVSNPSANLAVVVLAITFVGVWLGFWYFGRRGNSRLDRTKFGRRDEPTDGVAFSDLVIGSPFPPDSFEPPAEPAVPAAQDRPSESSNVDESEPTVR